MLFRNNHINYGVVAILLHWLMALLVFTLFGLGLYMRELDYYHPWYHSAPWWHKGLGVFTFGLLLLRTFWSYINPKPLPLSTHKTWEKRAATITHLLFYLALYLLCISGYLMATAAGKGVMVFDWFEIPAMLTNIDDQKDIIGRLHEVSAYVLMGFVALHVAGTLKHQFSDKDETLNRITWLAFIKSIDGGDNP